MAFKKAAKRDARLRFGFIGPAGSGKTRTALELASRIGKRVAVIDSERGRSRAYSDRFEFDVEDELPDFSPANYTKAIKQAETDGYDVIVIDSGSHEWAGKGGVLGMVDIHAAKSGNKFTAWAVGTPAHQLFIDSLLQCKAHLIITFRARTEWVLEDNEKGKKTPRAVGMGAVAREGTEYELDFVGLLDLDHRMTMIKTTNAAELEGKQYHMPGKDLADDMTRWLSTNTVPAAEANNGAAVPHAEATPPVQGSASADPEAVRTAEPTASPDPSPYIQRETADNLPRHNYAAKIAGAANEKDLQAVALEIKKAKPPIAGAERDRLLALYDARLAALREPSKEKAA